MVRSTWYETYLRNTIDEAWGLAGLGTWEKSKIVQARERMWTQNVFRFGHAEFKMPPGQLDIPVWSSEWSLWLEPSGSYQPREGGRIKALRTVGRVPRGHVKGLMGEDRTLGETQHLLSRGRKRPGGGSWKKIQSRRWARREWVMNAKEVDHFKEEAAFSVKCFHSLSPIFYVCSYAKFFIAFANDENRYGTNRAKM